ncbi:hypothetical protein G7085_00850 [Tessaracoccus sp. HDW20]|uniref:hypothetical protein n=1 Tax=Tessaracoccus coleopterorum TaxID=2714950 RepID=UPI0018D2B099|nr:hypothetical protein [Tessaracoccus coleopterorum]NHB83738.1 hypothetical protein [Tessaracoccus coleopterorum]
MIEKTPPVQDRQQVRVQQHRAHHPGGVSRQPGPGPHGDRPGGTVVQSCERSKQNNTWTATDFVVTHPSGEQFYSTAFFRLSGGKWTYAAHAGASTSTICDWVSRANVPSDLRDHVPTARPRDWPSGLTSG